MPGIKGILIGTNGQKELRELRGKAMECVGLIGKAVGAEKFGPDAVEILNVLFTTQSGGLDADDPQYQYMVCIRSPHSATQHSINGISC
jgi:hypothetical protein